LEFIKEEKKRGIYFIKGKGKEKKRKRKGKEKGKRKRERRRRSRETLATPPPPSRRTSSQPRRRSGQVEPSHASRRPKPRYTRACAAPHRSEGEQLKPRRRAAQSHRAQPPTTA